MNAFDASAILLTVAAVSGFLNRKLLRLPATSGILVVALASSLILVGFDALVPEQPVAAVISGFLASIDFNQALMHGMLCFLLFAGALHVDLDGLVEHRWTIGLLSTVAVALSTWMIGGLL